MLTHTSLARVAAVVRLAGIQNPVVVCLNGPIEDHSARTIKRALASGLHCGAVGVPRRVAEDRADDQ
jgi:hypothetical protein